MLCRTSRAGLASSANPGQPTSASRVRALGYLPPAVTLQAVMRAGGTRTRHPQFGWQVRATTVEVLDRVDRRGIVAFLVADTRHLGPVRAAEAVEQFGDRIFEVLASSPEELCIITGITPGRALSTINSPVVVTCSTCRSLRCGRVPMTCTRVPPAP